MATINTHRAKDGTLSYRVRIRMRGQPTQSASFPSLKDARRWAAMIEGQMIEGRHFPEKKSSHTLSELIARYYKDVHPQKSPKTRRREAFILRYWDDQLGHAFLSDIQPRDIIQRRDRLSTTRKPGTIHMYLAVLSHVFTTAVREYQWLEQNPCSRVSKPPLPQGRVRYLTDDERSRLLAACKESGNRYLYPLVLAALSTGMRQGELLGVCWRDIDLDQGTIYLEQTKNKRRRAVPLVGKALDAIRTMSEGQAPDTYVFPATNRSNPFGSYRNAWLYAVKKARLSEYCFHSNRHASASAMVQLGIPLYTVGTILGHTNPGAMTNRYAHMATENLRDALETMTNQIFP
jgi:integrase